MNWLDILHPCLQSRNRRYPIYARIKDRLKESIELGELGFNERLPADRELAGLLGIDRSTVARAYGELQAAGLVESTVGRGTFVTYRRADTSPLLIEREPAEGQGSFWQVQETGPLGTAAPNAGRGKSSGPPIIWREKFSRFSESISTFMARQPVAQGDGRHTISFAAGVPSHEFVPQDDFKEILRALAQEGRSARTFAYTEAEGEAELRREIIRHLQQEGMNAKDDELIVLSGSQQGIDLVSRTLIDPGDPVAIEDPSYFWALCNFTALGARVLPVPVDDRGLNLTILESLLARRRVKVLYVMPSFQNPTGNTMTYSDRQRLLEIARHYEVPVFEDNFVGDLFYDDLQPTPLRAMPGGDEIVIHQSTLSKSLCPGLRIGWMIAPAEARHRLLMSKRVTDLSTNSVSQAIVAEYLARGLYNEHLNSIRAIYAHRRDSMCDALASLSHFELAWKRPHGGMFIWVKLPQGYSARELLSLAEREGVVFSPGDLFFAGSTGKEYFRLSFIQSNESEIQEGIARLARATDSFFAQVKRRRSERSIDMRAGPGVFV